MPSLKPIVATLLEFAGDPVARAYAPEWLKSLLPWSTALRRETPWIPFRARAWLESYLAPDMRVFEYGSGGSTLYLARRVKELVSVEHDEDWYALVSRQLATAGIRNCRYILRQPEAFSGIHLEDGAASHCTSSKREWTGLGFDKYVKTLAEYPDESFDLVFVDGRARPYCVAEALNKVRRGGYLLLDDSQRSAYDTAKSLLSDHDRLDFRGVRPYSLDPGWSSVWRIGVRSRVLRSPASSERETAGIAGR